MLEDFQGDSWGLIPPLRMSSLLPHDLCHGRNASRQPPTVNQPMSMGHSSVEEKANWWRWGSLADSGWRGALMLDSYRGEGWGCREETDLKERAMSVFNGPWEQLHHLDSVDLYEAGFETQVWAHVVWFWSSVCFLRRCFPLTQLKSTRNFLNIYHHSNWPYITWFFLQLSHSSSLVNMHFPQMEMVLRKNGPSSSSPKRKSELRTWGWSQCDCSGPLTCTDHSALKS